MRAMDSDDAAELHAIRGALRARLDRLVDARIAWVPAAPAAPPAPAAAEPAAPRQSLALAEIRAELGECTRCKLHPTRKNIVFGVGDPHAELMFVGEGPGGNEDLQGEPFVGDAGQLLTKMIGAMGYRREDVYIANVVKCLRYNTPVLLENGSWERIGRLVRQRYSGRVMSVAPDGRIVPRRVTGWHATPLGDRRVYRLSYASAKKAGSSRVAIQLTHDHEVLTRRGYVRAVDLRPDDELALGVGLSTVAREVVVGSLLGDGSIGRAASAFAFVHCRDQDEYVRLIASGLRELSPIVDHGQARAKRDGAIHLTTRGRTRATRALRVLRSWFYPEGKKRVPADLRLTPRMFAIWFLDDGYTKVKSERSALSEIACHSFSAAERDFLVARLREDLGLDAYTRESSSGRIHFGAEASLRLAELIGPYTPGCLRYKLHPQARGRAFDPMLFEPGERQTLYDRAVIEPVAFEGTDRTFFCIDVEETSNFVTTGGVVHNCRPPGNRNPEPDEIAACEPFLKKQIAAVDPKVIVALGKFAAQYLAGRPDAAISALRGRWFDYQGIKVMPTYHPAYLLRTPSAKRTVWEDLQLVMTALGKPLP
jgi:uracil-DNA glycosylase family 4